MKWKTAPLKDVAKIERNSIQPERIEHESLYLGLEHIYSNGTYSPIQVSNGELKSNKFSFTESHILYGKLRPYLSKIAAPNFRGICSTDIIPIRPNLNLIDKWYLFRFLRTPEMIEFATSRCSGANLPRISPKAIQEFQIPLPPLPIQKKIAAILDAADAYRQKTKALIEKYDQLTQSLFLEMFGDPDIKSGTLESISLKITDGTHQSPKFCDNGIPFLLISNIVENKIDFNTSKFISETDYLDLYRRTPIEIGDILYTTVGSYGNPAMVLSTKKFMFQRHIGYIKPDHTKVDFVYLFGAMKSSIVKNQVHRKVKGIAQKTLNLKDLRSIMVPLPPLNSQKEFRKEMINIETQKDLCAKGLYKSEELFQSLLQRAFKGEGAIFGDGQSEHLGDVQVTEPQSGRERKIN